jgi:hypothetical protein
LVNWKTVCSPIARGGLGFKNLTLFNKALLGKWIWRFGNEKDYLCRQVIASKYGIQRRGGAVRMREVLMGLVSRGILRKIWGAFSNYISYEVGDGLCICFWNDIWSDDSAIKCSFPEFFSLAHNKEALVSEYIDRSNPHTL